jgi:hypothetical protein
MQERTSLLQEFWFYLKENKKWWMIPLIIMLLLLVGLFIVVGANAGLLPFIYTLI